MAIITSSVYELSREVQVRLEGKLIICVMSQEPQLDFEMARQEGLLLHRSGALTPRTPAADPACPVLPLKGAGMPRVPARGEEHVSRGLRLDHEHHVSCLDRPTTGPPFC